MKKTIFNFDWIYTLAFALFWFHGISIKSPTFYDIIIFISGIGLLYIFLKIPFYTVFSSESVSIHFLFGFYQEFKWKSIDNIERAGNRSEYLYYRISGNSIGKKCFFVSSKIRASKKAKQYIREFWKSDFNE